MSLSARRAWIEIYLVWDAKNGGGSLSARRAWIEIWPVAILLISVKMSLSARRAWIEIKRAQKSQVEKHVALRKESVDRNICYGVHGSFQRMSLSARRAWIEIWLASPYRSSCTCRSPQGERG